MSLSKKPVILHALPKGIHNPRRDEFRADRLAIEQALSNPKIVPIWNSVVESIEGEGLVEKLVLKNVKTGEISDLPVAGVFIFVGQEPTSPTWANRISCKTDRRRVDRDERKDGDIGGRYFRRWRHPRQVPPPGRDSCGRRGGSCNGRILLYHRTASSALRAHRARARICTSDVQHRPESDKSPGRDGENIQKKAE